MAKQARSTLTRTQKRRNWSQTSMTEAVTVNEGMKLTGASSSYWVPVETLRRRVIGAVAVDLDLRQL